MVSNKIAALSFRFKVWENAANCYEINFIENFSWQLPIHSKKLDLKDSMFNNHIANCLLPIHLITLDFYPAKHNIAS